MNEIVSQAQTMKQALTDRLETVLRQHEGLWLFLQGFDEIALPDAWLVAGIVAQTV
jgi:hypothetical protein